MALPTLENMQSVFADVQVEVFMFLLACFIHLLMFKGFRFVPNKGKIIAEKKCNVVTTALEMDSLKVDSCLARRETRSKEKMDVAYQKGYWAATLRHWYAQRDSEATTPGQLLQVMEAMQRQNFATASKMREISHFLSRHPGSCHIDFINLLFTLLVKSMDMEVIVALIECLPKFNIKPDSQTYEMLIQLHFTMQGTDEMLRLARDMEANGVAPSVATQVTLLKGALKKGDLNMAILLYCQVSESCPSYVESNLASLACQQRQGSRVIECFESKKLPLRLEMLDAMVRANLHIRDRKLATCISQLYKTFGIEIDSCNKHVFSSGPMQGESQSKVDSVGEAGHLAVQEQPTLSENSSCEAAHKAGSEQCSSLQHQQVQEQPAVAENSLCEQCSSTQHQRVQEQPTLAENSSCEAAHDAGSEQCSSPQHRQETSRVQETNQSQASGSWMPHKTNNWEQDDNKCHWEAGGAQWHRSSKWVEASGDDSWEYANWSWGSTKKPWAKEQNKEQYKDGVYYQTCSPEINKNCRKTWVRTEKVRPSQSPLPTALESDTAFHTLVGSSVPAPTGLGPESAVGHAAVS